MKKVYTGLLAVLVLTMLASASYAGPWRWQGNQNNTPGWKLMTPEERTEHQNKLRSFTDYDTCKAYVAEHHQQMEARAKEKGLAPPVMKRNPCDTMKAKGVLK